MGYQIGNTCYSDKIQAENVYFSSVSPTLTSDGQLIKPIFTNNVWTLNGQSLILNVPECSAGDNFQDGAQLGFLFLGIIASVWVIKRIGMLIR